MEIINKHWCGTDDLLNIISGFIEKTDSLIGSGMIKRIKKMFL